LFMSTEVSQVLLKLRKILGERSIDCYLTGGFVRDAIMRRDTEDIDVIVGASAMDVARDVAHIMGHCPWGGASSPRLCHHAGQY
jgi:tRNA nucleotidyltransferase/poly(A) polymerase